ncbi:MAG: Ferric uptake regulation protein FUR [Ignavibacteriae bacterium]|nr:MAG: Ferric uptake regulation protein FUR [Ignavibacteriota bacterium]
MNTPIEFEILKKHLKERNLRYTREREKILKSVLFMKDHFNAEELYITLKKQYKNVALATVYNTLELLTDCGILNRYRFGTDHYRYEKTLDKPSHYHLICLNCGKITEFNSNDLSQIENIISKKRNFFIKYSSLQIFGICDECQEDSIR